MQYPRRIQVKTKTGAQRLPPKQNDNTRFHRQCCGLNIPLNAFIMSGMPLVSIGHSSWNSIWLSFWYYINWLACIVTFSEPNPISYLIFGGTIFLPFSLTSFLETCVLLVFPSFPPSFPPSFLASLLSSFLPSFPPSFLPSFVPSFLPSSFLPSFLSPSPLSSLEIFFDMIFFLMPKKCFLMQKKIDCSPLLCTRALTGDVCKSDCWSVSPLRRGSGAVNCDALLLLLRIGAASSTTCWNSCRARQVVRHSQPVLIFVHQDSYGTDVIRLFHELPLFTVEVRHGFKHAGAQGSMSAAAADSLAHIDIQKSQR